MNETPTETLSPAEVKALTDKREREKQCAWLTEQGVPFRRDGQRIIVSREHVRQWLTGVKFAVSAEPNWSSVR